MLELRRLRLLHQLSLRGTISEVARELAYSPSTVSQQLALLEREAGVALLEPAGRRVQLTAQGQLLATHAARMIQLDEQARAELAALGTTPARVRIAAMTTAVQSLIPHALTLLAERAPGLRVEIAGLSPEDALFELVAGSFDLVVAEEYPGHLRALDDRLDKTPIGVDPIRVAVPRTTTAQSLADLRHHAWVLEPECTAVRQWAVQQCRAAGFEPDVRFESTDLTSHVRLVAAGHAVAILPDLVWVGELDNVRLIDLPGTPRREIFAATRVGSRTNETVASVRSALEASLSAHAPF